MSTLAALLVASGCDQLSQPRSYDDCILKHMDGATSDRAATLIRESCRGKFTDTRTGDETELTDAELAKLTGRVGVFGSNCGGTLYNGNTGIIVTSITIEVTSTLDGNSTSREYRDEITIPPLTAEDFAVNIIAGDEGTEYSWNLTSARGYRK